MAENKDKAYSFIFNDILDKILQLSENPSQFADYLTQQIREIVGARTIVIAIQNANQQAEIYSVFPTRRREWANQSNILQLSEITFAFDTIQTFDKDSAVPNISQILDQLEIEKIIAIPLIASRIKIGSILLFDIMDSFGLDAVLDLLTRISGISALIIRNSVLYHKLEETVAIRTQELQRKNIELNDANIQLNENLIHIQDINSQLEKSIQKAEESDRLKTAFLQNMSHEIRTPMNAIMGFSDLLAGNFNDKNKLKKFSDIIGQRCNDLLDIINDILDIAKIESGQLPVNHEVCNLSELFADLSVFFTEYQIRFGKQQIQFSLNASCDPCNNIIITDKVKLKQIFINLIGNAFKFTEKGRIEGGCKPDANNNILFYVSDTGIGIPADKQEMVFERFAQVHQGSKMNIGGTGLGLPIVKGLVELLGGKVFLESEPEKGSTFSFTVPIVTTQKLQHHALTPELPVFNILLNKTILIVEDDLYNTEYLKEILSGNGLNILHAVYGKDAVEISLSQQIDLVLMDIRLPDINGYEATSHILSHKPHLKIIAQTAYAAQDERKKAFDAGCVDYISKPTKSDSLILMISKHLSVG